MTRYLLDTTALIDFSKGHESTRLLILEWIEARETIGVCAIPVAEFYAGLPVPQAALWREFVSALTYWPITSRAAIQAGQYRYTFARHGKIIAITDALVASVAGEQGAVVVTGNVKDYPMDDITVFPLLP